MALLTPTSKAQRKESCFRVGLSYSMVIKSFHCNRWGVLRKHIVQFWCFMWWWFSDGIGHLLKTSSSALMLLLLFFTEHVYNLLSSSLTLLIWRFPSAIVDILALAWAGPMSEISLQTFSCIGLYTQDNITSEHLQTSKSHSCGWIISAFIFLKFLCFCCLSDDKLLQWTYLSELWF